MRLFTENLINIEDQNAIFPKVMNGDPGTYYISTHSQKIGIINFLIHK